jgi:hypothetical protein
MNSLNSENSQDIWDMFLYVTRGQIIQSRDGKKDLPDYNMSASMSKE